MSAQRWAAVGTGTISRSVVPDLMSCAGAEVTLVQSRNAEKAAAFAEEFGIPASTGDFDAVLADDAIDAIYLATPFASHHEMARAALLAGKHVLVEKPMAMDAAEVADLFAVAAEQGLFVMEAMWMKFNPAFRRLHDELRAGAIGDVRSLRASFGIPSTDPTGSRWDITRSGGALLDQGIYPIALAHSVFGVPDRVHAAGTVADDGLDLAEHFTLEYSDGRFIQAASSMTEFVELTASVSGTKGWLTLTTPFWATMSLDVHAGGMRQIFHAPDRVEFELEGHGYVPMLREVIAAIDDGLIDHPVHGAADTLAVFHTIDEIFVQIRGAAAPGKGASIV